MAENGAVNEAHVVGKPTVLRVASLQKAAPAPRPSLSHAYSSTIVPEQAPTGLAPASSQAFRSLWPEFNKLDTRVKMELSQQVPSSQMRDARVLYNKWRTWAMEGELEEYFFTGCDRLAGYQALCVKVRIEPSDTIAQCRADLRGTLVNIVDLVEAVRAEKPVKVWRREDWNCPGGFLSYMQKPRNCFQREEAKKSELLVCFLQDLSRSQPRLSGNPRPLGSGSRVGLLTPAPTSSSSGDAWSSEEDTDTTSTRVINEKRPVHVSSTVKQVPTAKLTRCVSIAGSAKFGDAIGRHAEAIGIAIKEEAGEGCPRLACIPEVVHNMSKTGRNTPKEDAQVTIKKEGEAQHPSLASPAAMPSHVYRTGSKRGADTMDITVKEESEAKRPKFSPAAEIRDSDLEDNLTDFFASDADDDDIFKQAMANCHKNLSIVMSNEAPRPPTARRLLQAGSQGEAAPPST